MHLRASTNEWVNEKSFFFSVLTEIAEFYYQKKKRFFLIFAGSTQTH
eukprot:COSAG01_NODE_153_length_23909_cov_32.542018_24_plen_47_part_00